MNELVFEVIQENDGGYCAECLTENIFTQGDNWDELRRNVQEAVSAFYFDQPACANLISSTNFVYKLATADFINGL